MGPGNQAAPVQGRGYRTKYDYDDLGNLTKKTDYGTVYTYGTVTWDGRPEEQRWVRGTGNAGPHAVRQVTKAAAAGGGVVDFTYDDNGNLTDGDGRHIDFDLMDRPVKVLMGGAETEFAYGPSGGRYRQKLSGTPGPGFGPKTVYYVDKDYELTVWDTGSAQPEVLEERTFIGPSVTVLTKKTAAGVKTRSVRYRHVDRLGSPDADTAEDVGATLVEAHGLDAWGKPRDGSWLPNGDQLHPGGEAGSTSTRGFTGHEHLDSAYLIHMNGRVYDYRLGRFLSVDPIISNPLSSQAINPYSYIGNNPLSGTDPTGYAARKTEQDGSVDGGGVGAETAAPGMIAKAQATSGAVGATAKQAPGAPDNALTPAAAAASGGNSPPAPTCAPITLPFGEAGTTKVNANQEPHGPNNMALDTKPKTGPADGAEVVAPFDGKASFRKDTAGVTNGALTNVVVKGDLPGVGKVELTNTHVDNAGSVPASGSEVAVQRGDKIGKLSSKESQGTQANGNAYSSGPHNHWYGTLNGKKLDIGKVIDNQKICTDYVH